MTGIDHHQQQRCQIIPSSLLLQSKLRVYEKAPSTSPRSPSKKVDAVKYLAKKFQLEIQYNTSKKITVGRPKNNFSEMN